MCSAVFRPKISLKRVVQNLSMGLVTEEPKLKAKSLWKVCGTLGTLLSLTLECAADKLKTNSLLFPTTWITQMWLSNFIHQYWDYILCKNICPPDRTPQKPKTKSSIFAWLQFLCFHVTVIWFKRAVLVRYHEGGGNIAQQT